MMRYRASKLDCDGCSLKPRCCPNAPARIRCDPRGLATLLLKPESMNARRIFSREYKLEAVKLVKERGVAVRRRPVTVMFMECAAQMVGNMALIQPSLFRAKGR